MYLLCSNLIDNYVPAVHSVFRQLYVPAVRPVFKSEGQMYVPAVRLSACTCI